MQLQVFLGELYLLYMYQAVECKPAESIVTNSGGREEGGYSCCRRQRSSLWERTWWTVFTEGLCYIIQCLSRKTLLLIVWIKNQPILIFQYTKSGVYYTHTVCRFAVSPEICHSDLLDLCLVTPTDNSSPALSCVASSIFLQLYLKPAVHISFWSSRLLVFFGRPLPAWPCAVHCSACSAMLSPLRLSVWPSQFHFLLFCWTNTSSWSVFSIVPCWIFCLASGCLRVS